MFGGNSSNSSVLLLNNFVPQLFSRRKAVCVEEYCFAIFRRILLKLPLKGKLEEVVCFELLYVVAVPLAIIAATPPPSSKSYIVESEASLRNITQ